MSRLLLLILVILAVWMLAKGSRRKGAGEPSSETSPEKMVRCGHCGLYLPQSEAVSAGDRYFCSDEHRRLAQ